MSTRCGKEENFSLARDGQEEEFHVTGDGQEEEFHVTGDGKKEEFLHAGAGKKGPQPSGDSQLAGERVEIQYSGQIQHEVRYLGTWCGGTIATLEICLDLAINEHMTT